MRTLLLSLVIAFVLSGCGAIVHGTRQDITISSSPSQAQVLVQGEQKITPAVFNLKRKHSYIIKISKEGYDPSEVIILNKLDWVALVDIFAGVLPVFYELTSGAAWKLTPEDINVSLNRSIGYKDGPEVIPIGLKIRNNNLSVIGSGEGVTITVTQIE